MHTVLQKRANHLRKPQTEDYVTVIELFIIEVEINVCKIVKQFYYYSLANLVTIVYESCKMFAIRIIVLKDDMRIFVSTRTPFTPKCYNLFDNLFITKLPLLMDSNRNPMLS